MILSLFLQLDQQAFRRDQDLQVDRKDQVSVREHRVKQNSRSLTATRIIGHLRVLLHKLGEIVEKTVLWAQKVKLVVPLFLLHELSEKLTAVSSHKLGGELDNVQVKCGYRWWICNKLKLRRWFFGDNRLLNHLGLHLLKTKHNIVFAPQDKRWKTWKSDLKAVSYFLGKLLGLLHRLLHDLGHCCRRLLSFAFFKFIDLMSVVGVVGIIRVKEIKLWIVDLILADSCFKLWSIPVK